MHRHYILEIIIVLMVNLIDDLMERIEELEEKV